MIVLAARFVGTLFGCQILLSRHKKMDKENSPRAKVDCFLFQVPLSTRKYKIKISCHRHFNSASHKSHD